MLGVSRPHLSRPLRHVDWVGQSVDRHDQIRNEPANQAEATLDEVEGELTTDRAAGVLAARVEQRPDDRVDALLAVDDPKRVRGGWGLEAALAKADDIRRSRLLPQQEGPDGVTMKQAVEEIQLLLRFPSERALEVRNPQQPRAREGEQPLDLEAVSVQLADEGVVLGRINHLMLHGKRARHSTPQSVGVSLST